MIACCMTMCTALRKVSLHIDWSKDTWAIIHATSNLPELQTLSLSGPDGGVALQTIFKYINQSSLRHMRLSRYGFSDGDKPMAVWRPTAPSSQMVLDKLSASAGKHSSRVTELSLSDPSAIPGATEILVRRSARLEKLTMKMLKHTSFAGHYTVDAIQRILDVHRASLRHITIGIIPLAYHPIPDLSAFPSLCRLHLSAFDVFAETPAAAQKKVSAPCLEQLILDFNTEDQHKVNWREFNKTNVDWLDEFATHYKVMQNLENKLHTIVVEFSPECWGYGDEVEILGTSKWPWEYLIQARDMLSKHEMTLKWNEPCLTREEWVEMQRAKQDRNADPDPEGVAEVLD